MDQTAVVYMYQGINTSWEFKSQFLNYNFIQNHLYLRLQVIYTKYMINIIIINVTHIYR